MKWVLIYFALLFGLAQLASCTTPITWANKYNNLLTPDRLGAGVSNGTMNAHGVSNKFFNNQPVPMDMDIDGDTYSSSIWLEWDIPQWKEEPNYDQYLRDRIRVLHLEKLLLQEEQEIKEVEQSVDENTSLFFNDSDCLEYYRKLGQYKMWPYKLTEPYYL